MKKLNLTLILSVALACNSVALLAVKEGPKPDYKQGVGARANEMVPVEEETTEDVKPLFDDEETQTTTQHSGTFDDSDRPSFIQLGTRKPVKRNVTYSMLSRYYYPKVTNKIDKKEQVTSQDVSTVAGWFVKGCDELDNLIIDGLAGYEQLDTAENLSESFEKLYAHTKQTNDYTAELKKMIEGIETISTEHDTVTASDKKYEDVFAALLHDTKANLMLGAMALQIIGKRLNSRKKTLNAIKEHMVNPSTVTTVPQVDFTNHSEFIKELRLLSMVEEQMKKEEEAKAKAKEAEEKEKAE